MKFVPLLLPLVVLTACVPLPVPHHSVNAPRFSGRVVSAATHRPISGASVVLRGLGDTAVETDPAGRFLTRISRTTHLAGIYTYDDGLRLQFPPARSSDGTLLVSRSGYDPAEVPANCAPYPQPFQSDSQVATVPLPDIRLRPTAR